MPLALGALVMVVMYTWRRGSRLLFEKTRKTEVPLDPLVATLERKPPHRVPGTAVFFTSDPSCAPTAMMHSLKHYKVLHEKNVILTIEHAGVPRVDPAERVQIEPLGETFSRVRLRFGFMESPNVPKALAIARRHGWQFDIMNDVVLPVAPRAQARRAFRHAALAGPAVHRARPQRQRRHRLFPDSDRAGGRGRNPGDDLDACNRARRDGLRAMMYKIAPKREELRHVRSEVRDPPVHDLTPEDVARGLAEGRMLLVDVRELNETAVERYPDAVIVPLSSFDPSHIPDPQGKQVVFACRSGRRSVTASQAAQAHGLPYDSHLAGGILAWKAAGLPTES